MKNFVRISVLLVLCATSLFSLTLSEVIALALENSDKVKEQEHLSAQSKNLMYSQYAKLSPKLDLRYSVTQSNRSIGDYTISLTDLNASFNLFNGLKDFYTIKQYQSLLSAQNYLYEATREDIILLAKTLYIQILQARDNLAISTESIRLLELQRNQAEEFYKQGIRAKSDLLSVEVTLANAKITQSNDKNILNYALLSLQKLIMREVNVNTLEPLSLQADTEKLNFKYEDLQRQMFASRSEYLYMQQLLNALDLQKKALWSAFLPSLDVNYSRLWYKRSAATPTYSGANLNSRAQLSLSWNLFSGLSDKFAIEVKGYEKLAAQSQMSDLKKELNLSLNKALDDLNTAKTQYSVAKNAVKMAQENYKIVQNRYKQNIETSRELLNAEVALSQARLHFNQSEHKINLALANLERIIQNPLQDYQNTQK